MDIVALRSLRDEVMVASGAGDLTEESIAVFTQSLEDIVDEPANLEIEIIDAMEAAASSKAPVRARSSRRR